MNSRKVGIIGVGAVGATAAYTLSMMGNCHEIILFDIAPGVAQGKAIDIAQASYYAPQGTIVNAAEDISDIKNCDIVVITAGVPRKGDMTRADLLMINARIIKDVTTSIKENSPDAIIICVSNPLDVMTYVINKITNWDSNRIIGMAGALDGSRMAYQIQKKTGYSARQTGSLVIGDHGENMIPLPHRISVGDIPLSDLVTNEDMEEIINKTKNGGAEIVKHLGTSGYYGPGRAIAHMVEAILNDSKTIVPSSVLLNGEYGYNDVCVGVPVVLGAKGTESIIELNLLETTKEKLKLSVDSIKDGIKILEENNFFEGI
ncbi:MAG: malate dehydrogenase [Campylobacteraceae bacterium]|jgi:malate dehydrogenase|nr:malate dehydrogenase [Campylobacteraceae bacterium]MBT3881879.1 malate dehydrogenase [Campylobacteraceae bacterium]MBT4030341.1 malate dehydrogenase [Campylobacteraceae bacterium]MBT4179418.1 malate dehydrogenase [Campylobacteraceae bacterium]MBT4572769.1 malate dehydrogenase [Campylobacteraceae bacterium]